MSLKHLICIGVAALVLVTGSPAVSAPEPSVVGNPEWLYRPDGDDVAELYPPIALQFGVSGQVTLECAVDSYGALRDCSAADESPKALGFGSAAVSLAPKFRMTPKLLDGRPVDGGSVRIPIHFKAPAAPEAPAVPPSPPGAATDRARRLVSIVWSVDQAGAFRRWLEQTDVSGPGVEEGVRSAAQQALEGAGPVYLGYVQANLSAFYATEFTAEELEALVAFFLSPAGQRMLKGPAPEVQAELARANDNLISLTLNRARDEFCLDHPCSVVADSKTLRAAAGRWNATIVEPEWAEVADDDQIWDAFPIVPKHLQISGWSLLVCKVDGFGLLEGCQVAIEQAAGLGFGAAALSLTPRFRLAPRLMAQGAHRDTVAVWIGFPYETQPATPLEPAEDTPEFALARRVVSLSLVRNTPFEEHAADLLAVDAAALGPGVKQDAVTALRRSYETWLAQLPEIKVRFYAAMFSEPELRQVVAFRESAVGRKWMNPEIDERQALVFEGARIAADQHARATFCAAHECEAK